MGLLELEDIRLDLGGSHILNGVSLDLWGGHCHAIVGPNGAGKSTLAFTIMGLEGYRDFTGEIRFEGESIRDESIDQRARRGITLGWQEPARYEGLSIRKFLQCSMRGEGNGDRTAELLNQVGLAPGRYIDRAVDKTLSGGERKKLELASILAMEPRLVLLDEPDSGIDVESLQRIHDAIGLLTDAGATVLLITHSLEVLRWSDHAFLMCCGRILDKGEVDKILQYFGNKCLPCDHKNWPQQDELLRS